MKVPFWRLLGCSAGLTGVLLAGGCSSSAPKKQEKPELPVGFHYDQPASKTDPNVVEETDSYYIRRYKKSEMVRVGENHIRPPVLTSKVALPIYREDANYYYIRTEKFTPEEIAAAKAAREKSNEQFLEERKKRQRAREGDTTPELTEKDFETLTPARGAEAVRFEKAGKGLPESGQYRQSFAVADLDGDGHLDIIAPPARLTSGDKFLVFLGDGKGNFHPRQPRIVDESGKPVHTAGGYGAIAVADFDGDGKLDVATASHGGGANVYLQRDGFEFVPMNSGLPTSKFSTQAIAAFDVDGDGKIDLVISRDAPEDLARKTGVDMTQVRVYQNLGREKGWKYLESSLTGGYTSYDLFPFQLDGETATSLLMGSNYLGGTYLPWRNDGKGNFKGFTFDAIELSALHLGIAPGHVGKDRSPAFADLYVRLQAGTKLRAAGLSIYVDHNGAWTRIPVWRQKDYEGSHLYAVAMGDLDGDGLDDVVFADEVEKKLRIFFQKPDGTFVEAPGASEPSVASAVTDIKLADLNGDGKLDVILAETVYGEETKEKGGFEVFLNQGK